MWFIGLCLCQTKNPMQRWVQHLVNNKVFKFAQTKGNILSQEMDPKI
jgi:hypothetical protein